ncbi:MAG TPA: hypothetical protein VM935_06660 [Chitinophagaceae bacterium]|nr:hypothetical protein [Chitinophagaceae bacterium]
MQENLKDILSNLSPDVDQKALLQYLQGQLSAEQQHQLEKEMMNSEFSSDALEGLSNMSDQQRIQAIVDHLNSELRKKTEKKKAYKQKLQIRQPHWAIIAIVFILLLVVISYFIITRYLQ